MNNVNLNLNERLDIRLSEDLKVLLKQNSKRHGLTQSALIRIMLIYTLHEQDDVIKSIIDSTVKDYSNSAMYKYDVLNEQKLQESVYHV